MKIALFAFLLLGAATSTLAKETSNMFPPSAIEADDNYRDWYGPALRDLREKPLWIASSVPPDTEIFRFTFIRGAMLVKGYNSAVIRITVPKSGVSEYHFARLFNDRGAVRFEERRASAITAPQSTKLRELYLESDMLAFPVGTWENGDDISIHCTELIMERSLNDQYNVSQVLISCGQPKKLMPLIDLVVSLGKLEPQQLFYQRAQP